MMKITYTINNKKVNISVHTCLLYQLDAINIIEYKYKLFIYTAGLHLKKNENGTKFTFERDGGENVQYTYKW